ncbi:MAG: NUDIX domain-containing protein [Armatimonadota bacterium]
MDDTLREKLLSSRTVFQGRLLTLRVDEVELPNGARATREIVPHPGAVVIVPLLDDGRVVMIRQYRHATGKVLWELPAGLLGKGEEPESAARRELVEEVGYEAGEMVPLFSVYLSPGFSGELAHIFLARGLRKVGVRSQPDETICAAEVPLGEALAMVRRGEVQNAAAVCGLLAVAE